MSTEGGWKSLTQDKALAEWKGPREIDDPVREILSFIDKSVVSRNRSQAEEIETLRSALRRKESEVDTLQIERDKLRDQLEDERREKESYARVSEARRREGIEGMEREDTLTEDLAMMRALAEKRGHEIGLLIATGHDLRKQLATEADSVAFFRRIAEERWKLLNDQADLIAELRRRLPVVRRDEGLVKARDNFTRVSADWVNARLAASEAYVQAANGNDPAVQAMVLKGQETLASLEGAWRSLEVAESNFRSSARKEG